MALDRTWCVLHSFLRDFGNNDRIKLIFERSIWLLSNTRGRSRIDIGDRPFARPFWVVVFGRVDTFRCLVLWLTYWQFVKVPSNLFPHWKMVTFTAIIDFRKKCLRYFQSLKLSMRFLLSNGWLGRFRRCCSRTWWYQTFWNVLNFAQNWSFFRDWWIFLQDFVEIFVSRIRGKMHREKVSTIFAFHNRNWNTMWFSMFDQFIVHDFFKLFDSAIFWPINVVDGP